MKKSGYRTIEELMGKTGCLSVANYRNPHDKGSLIYRFEFSYSKQAKEVRRGTGCGGWILGRWLFPGTGWTPNAVMMACPDSGRLE